MAQALPAGAAPRAARRRSPRLGDFWALAALLILAVVFLFPFAWLILTALKTPDELQAYPTQWLPHVAQWGNFSSALTMIDYGRYAWDTFLLSALYAVLTTASSALVGFGFARLRGRGKPILFMLMLSTVMLPPIITIIPTYVLFARLGLINTYWPWVLWGLSASPYLSFLFRQFFANIPMELEDAAIIDGCGFGRIFATICIPLSKPAVATVALFSFQWVWGDWFTPSIFLSSANTTLAVAMSAGYTSPQGFPLYNVLSAGTILYVLPVLVLFFFAQRYFVQGIVTTGLKG